MYGSPDYLSDMGAAVAGIGPQPKGVKAGLPPDFPQTAQYGKRNIISGAVNPAPVQPNMPHLKQALPPITPNSILPYPMRAGVAPYTYNYELANSPLGLLGDIGMDPNNGWKIGFLSSSLIVAGAVAGYSLEKTIARKVGAAGYGAIFGAIGANALRLGIAATMIGGIKSGIYATLGGAAPMTPLILAATMKKPLKKEVAYVVGAMTGIAALGLIWKHHSSTPSF